MLELRWQTQLCPSPKSPTETSLEELSLERLYTICLIGLPSSFSLPLKSFHVRNLPCESVKSLVKDQSHDHFPFWTDSIFGLGYLEWLSGEIVKGVNSSSGAGEVTLLNAIIDPFVDKIIQVRKSSFRFCRLNKSLIPVLLAWFPSSWGLGSKRF